MQHSSASLAALLTVFKAKETYSKLHQGLQRSSVQNLCRQVLHYQYQHQNQYEPVTSTCDAFINHRGVDTKRTVAGLLYDHLTRLHVHPFLDSKNLKPGDKLFQEIDSSIRNCKLGIAILSPRYSESYWCLHELSLLLEMNKKVIPIFWDVKPSELRVKDNGSYSAYDLRRFKWALEEAKYTVGFTFDSAKGDWSQFLKDISDAVMKILAEQKEGKEQNICYRVK